MKSIRELAWNVEEPEYRKDKAYSYSTLSRFEREGWRKIRSLFDKVDTPALTFGSAVDTLLTDGEIAFDQRFIICSFPSISDTLVSIVRELHRRHGKNCKTLADIEDREIDVVAIANGYYTGSSYAALRKKNIRACEEYYSLLTLAGERTVLAQEDYDDVIRCITELRDNSTTSDFFTNNPFESHIEKVFQLKFKAEYNGIPVRCMFDELIVDHEKKIISPIDLKTTGHPEEEFEGSFVQWRYDIQGKLYTYVLQQVIEKDEYFKDFKIEYYQFVVINRRTVAPVVWEFHDNFSESDLTTESGFVLRDWRKIIVDLDYYMNNPNVKYKREVQENRGRMKISNLRTA